MADEGRELKIQLDCLIEIIRAWDAVHRDPVLFTEYLTRLLDLIEDQL